MLEKLHDDATFESDPRFKQWVNASKGSIHYEGYMQYFIRGLGWLDVELIALDEMHFQRFWAVESESRWMQPEARIKAFKIGHLSEFWVMGGWEVVSTIRRRFNRPGIKEQYSAEAFHKLKQSKDSFLEIRNLLAKFEPPGERESSQTAWELSPYTQRGMRWQAKKDRVIYRRDLADQLLDALTSLATEMPHHKKPIIAHQWVKPR